MNVTLQISYEPNLCVYRFMIIVYAHFVLSVVYMFMYLSAENKNSDAAVITETPTQERRQTF